MEPARRMIWYSSVRSFMSSTTRSRRSAARLSLKVRMALSTSASKLFLSPSSARCWLYSSSSSSAARFSNSLSACRCSLVISVRGSSIQGSRLSMALLSSRRSSVPCIIMCSPRWKALSRPAASISAACFAASASRRAFSSGGMYFSAEISSSRTSSEPAGSSSGLRTRTNGFSPSTSSSLRISSMRLWFSSTLAITSSFCAWSARNFSLNFFFCSRISFSSSSAWVRFRVAQCRASSL
mmetsp:Transcript_11845/g.28102  ORF Transcript_11845/g.28102 Transcript_11845/m.28102 type:complete len:239 (-) Transcript_11845:714-1430(-)